MYDSIINYKQRVYMENVISYRNKVTREEMDEIINLIDIIIMRNDAKKTGNPITVTHCVELIRKQIKVDWEIKVPVDRVVTVPKGFEFLPEFEVNNAIRLRVPGNAKSINQAMPKIVDFIDSYNNAPVTPFYVEMVTEGGERFAEIFVGLYR